MTKNVERGAAEVEFRALAERAGAKVVARHQPGWWVTALRDPGSPAPDDEYAQLHAKCVYDCRRKAAGEIALMFPTGNKWHKNDICSFVNVASWTEALVDLKRYLRQNHPEKFTLDELTVR